MRSLGIPERSPFPYGARFATHFVRSINIGRGIAPGSVKNKHGMYEVFSYPGIDALCVSAVGGGSYSSWSAVRRWRARASRYEVVPVSMILPAVKSYFA